MKNEMDQFIASIYGTGVSEEEKTAAYLQELEKEAAVEAFKDAVIAEGIDLDEYTDQGVGEMFGHFKEAFEKTAAEATGLEVTDDELVKQAWAEADAYGRALAQQEFVNLVKEAKKYPYEKAKGFIPRAKQIFMGGMKPGHQKAISDAQKEVNYLRHQMESAKPGTKAEAKAEEALSYAKAQLRAFKGQARAESAKTIAARTGVGAVGVGGIGGAGYAAGRGTEKKGSATPFLDSVIEKRAMVLGVNSGLITPDGDCNIDGDGDLVYEPEWAGQYDTEVKTAFDANVHVAALHHLEALGYPVDWEE